MNRAVNKKTAFHICLFLAALTPVAPAHAIDPLASWNEGETKASIIRFVQEVSAKNSGKFVPPAQRIATFDNDGTLWLEQPMYVQVLFTLDRLHALASTHPEWKTREPFKSALTGDMAQVFAGGDKAILELVAATHAGITPEEFAKIVKEWLATSKDSRFKRLHTQLVYQPMLELLAYLRKNEFKTYIVTGGGIEFVRAFSDITYGVPPEQVIGSCIKTKFEYNDGKPIVKRLPEIEFIDDKGGKPVGIEKFIGRRPIAAFGNSDGDLEMLQWTAAGKGERFCLYVHHTDKEREYAYDRGSKIGALDKGLDESKRHGWTVVDMKRDWKTIFPSN